MRKISLLIILIAVLGFLSACGSTGPKHFETLSTAPSGGVDKIPTLPPHLVGKMVIHTPNGTFSGPATSRPAAAPAPRQPLAYQPDPAPEPSPAPAIVAPSYNPDPPPLSVTTKEYLDRQTELHRQGQQAIVGIEARWPGSTIPGDHMAYAVQNYLRSRGINVGIEPSIIPGASKSDAGLRIQR